MSENLDEIMGFTQSELEVIEAALDLWVDHQTDIVGSLTEAGVNHEDFNGFDILDEVAEGRQIRDRITQLLGE